LRLLGDISTLNAIIAHAKPEILFFPPASACPIRRPLSPAGAATRPLNQAPDAAFDDLRSGSLVAIGQTLRISPEFERNTEIRSAPSTEISAKTEA